MESGQCCVVSISMAKLESEQKVNFKSKKVISLTFRICIFHFIFWFIAVMLPYDSFSDIIVFDAHVQICGEQEYKGLFALALFGLW